MVVQRSCRTADTWKGCPRARIHKPGARLVRRGPVHNQPMLLLLPLLHGSAASVTPAVARQPTAVVIGGGWAGFGAAWGLAQRGVAVTVLEASSDAVGGLAAGWKGPDGLPVELGIHGFWRSYSNCFRLCDQIGLSENEVFTQWATPALYTRDGLSVAAPIFGDLPRLPTPLGSAVYPKFGRLSLADRASAIGLLYEFVDFDGSPEAWERYDGMSARDLYARAGVSRSLYDEFLEPMNLVLPMAPGEEVSAAAALSLLQFFALEHQADFDVRWLKGSLTETIFKRWVERLEGAGAQVLRGKRVNGVSLTGSTVEKVSCVDGSEYEADAVVMAVGISGAKAIVRGCPELASRSEFAEFFLLRAVDVVAIRLWLPRKLTGLPYPSNVVGGGVPERLQDVGWTFYHLNELHDSMRDEEGSVIECDFYHAGPLLPLSDSDAVRVALEGLHTLLPEHFRSPDLEQSELRHASVLKVPQAVSHFCPGAYRHLPQGVKAPSLDNFYLAGDWVDRGGHRSWSQEKAMVTGLQAAAAAASRMPRGTAASGARTMSEAELTPLDVEETEPHVALARRANRELLRQPLEAARSLLPFLPLPGKRL